MPFDYVTALEDNWIFLESRLVQGLEEWPKKLKPEETLGKISALDHEMASNVKKRCDMWRFEFEVAREENQSEKQDAVMELLHECLAGLRKVSDKVCWNEPVKKVVELFLSLLLKFF